MVTQHLIAAVAIYALGYLTGFLHASLTDTPANTYPKGGKR